MKNKPLFTLECEGCEKLFRDEDNATSIEETDLCRECLAYERDQAYAQIMQGEDGDYEK